MLTSSMILVILLSVCQCNAMTMDINLHNYNQSQSYTKCTKGLLVQDILHIRASVKVSTSDEINRGFFRMERKRSTDTNFNGYDDVFVNQCGMTNLQFTCVHNKAENSFELILKAKADASLSVAHWRLRASLIDFEKISEEIKIPTIYDPQNVSIKLNDTIYIGDEIPIDLYNYTNTLCCHDAPSPCDVVIKQDGAEEIKGSECLTLRLNTSGVYSIGYYVCNLGNFSRRYRTHITLKYIEANDSGEMWIPIVLSIAIFLVLAAAVGLILYGKGYISCHSLSHVVKKWKRNQPGVGLQRNQEQEPMNVVCNESCRIPAKVLKNSPSRKTHKDKKRFNNESERYPKSSDVQTRSRTSNSETNSLRKRKDADSK